MIRCFPFSIARHRKKRVEKEEVVPERTGEGEKGSRIFY